MEVAKAHNIHNFIWEMLKRLREEPNVLKGLIKVWRSTVEEAEQSFRSNLFWTKRFEGNYEPDAGAHVLDVL